jgi:glycosyltransferase involved in cell wall biosynthesis
MVSKIKLSIALVTRDRNTLLERCLMSLRAQSTQPFEVLVSDDSGPEYARQIEALATRYKCLYLPGPRRGLYANRNFVATRCMGTHIRTMDDDHVLPPGHLELCLSAVETSPNTILTTGEIGFIDGKQVAVHKTAAQLGPSGVGEAVHSVDDNWAIADGSTIYPRAVFDRGFRMVEDFRFGSSYLEFGAYLYKNGWRSRAIPGALIEHRTVSLSAPDPVSIAFASICFNRYFRPNSFRLVRHLIPQWRVFDELPQLFLKAKTRWIKG